MTELKNKAKGMKILLSRILQQQKEKNEAEKKAHDDQNKNSPNYGKMSKGMTNYKQPKMPRMPSMKYK